MVKKIVDFNVRGTTFFSLDLTKSIVDDELCDCNDVTYLFVTE